MCVCVILVALSVPVEFRQRPCALATLLPTVELQIEPRPAMIAEREHDSGRNVG